MVDEAPAGDGLNALIANIYGGVLALDFTVFKERTLSALSAMIPFASGVWASGVYSSNTMHSVALLRQPPDMLLAYAMRWQEEDFVRAAALASPGQAFRNEDVADLDAYHRSSIYLEFSKPSGIEHILSVVHADLETDLGEILCLFRDDPQRPFTDGERSILETLLPHLVTAWRQRQALHRYESGGQAEVSVGGHAVVDDKGMLQTVEARLSSLLRGVWPNWNGPLLPAEAARVLREGSVRVAGLEVRIVPGQGRHLLSVRKLGDDGLTLAETKVARLFADGGSNRAVAAQLGVSPATVRNQLASIYRKLDIHSKAELARLIPPT